MRMTDIQDESMAELDFTPPAPPPSVRLTVERPIAPSQCPVCKQPVNREVALCARCRVAA